MTEYCTYCGKKCHKEHGCPSHGWADRELLYCPYCGTMYWEEDFHMPREYEEFWGAPYSYEIFDHAICHECGGRYE